MLDNYRRKLKERGYDFSFHMDCHWLTLHITVTDGIHEVTRSININPEYENRLVACMVIKEVEQVVGEMMIAYA